MKTILLCATALLLSACSSTEGLEMPNSPCACSYDGQQLSVPSEAEIQNIIHELVS
ncbi:hypothetical protein [Vibrio scophthalmi]|jgi:hypothetical protein|uniref:Lipoprotein n=1 Tax=Vibrio scophthalmi TaxID=45658 RepID=A0A1E3WIS2_9VIBR|nr:hypothetical protein [Vibrio scophthalmi]ODS09648.1 hypothetical protein VSF3289_03312 [Vibrio scophthalmi]ODS09706.1 hypothetical protein VSF3289_03269 [Vibrio scophthalmi]